jgi:hypothetical protein
VDEIEANRLGNRGKMVALVDDLRTAELEAKHLGALFMDGGSGG